MTKIYHASTSRHDEWKGPKRWLRIVVHESVEDLVQAAKDYTALKAWDGAVGAFHPSEGREKWDSKKKAWVPALDPYFAGVIRLCKDWLTIEVVAHECVHAGISIYRSNIKSRVVLGSEVGPNEEYLCYIIGDITSAVFAALNKEIE